MQTFRPCSRKFVITPESWEYSLTHSHKRGIRWRAKYVIKKGNKEFQLSYALRDFFILESFCLLSYFKLAHVSGSLPFMSYLRH